ncbi:selenide, water dikinase [Desemzia sp. RIT804]|uniref:septation ring formation regulator EzrA n=1 Tax=Desemzia sp. RIT 804 TaxID=2810209 RepID=UPI001951DDB4|nr:septation ring formation regulator EzrA [Desemzia sp. RIT 804]MBM6613530.1 selenide, water dikinase [Desemzia sp. RIT 804]
MNVEITVIVIIVLAIAAFAASYVMRKKHYRIVDELEEQKLQLSNMPIVDDIHMIKTLNLTGQTEENFQKWKTVWEDVEKVSLPAIENHLFEAERSIDKLRLKKAQDSEKQAESMIKETKDTLLKIQEALSELVRGEEKNRLELEKVKEMYQSIRKKLLTQSFSFGPALEKLEHKLTILETDFATFSEYTSQGDHIEAKEVLEEVRTKTQNLDILVQEIPALLKEINGEFVDQLKEIKLGYQMLKEEDFQFPDDRVLEKVSETDQERLAAEKLAGNLEIEAAKEKIPLIEEEIDQLYDVMEIEMEASQYVTENKEKIEQLITYLTRKNNKLLIEIDRVSQSYKLNHDELKQTKDFKNQLDELTETVNYYLQALQQKDIVYSEVKESFQSSIEKLEEVDKGQNDIAQHLKELRKEETEVKASIDDFEFNMRAMKRYIEKQHLPGLPADYMDLFFAVTQKIENLSIEINKLRIDMDEIKKMADFIEDDIELLLDKTEEIVDTALLTEYMTQYANRYRQSTPQIASATQKSFKLFNQEHNYREALETISTALEEVEPGAYKKVETMYFNEIKPKT